MFVVTCSIVLVSLYPALFELPGSIACCAWVKKRSCGSNHSGQKSLAYRRDPGTSDLVLTDTLRYKKSDRAGFDSLSKIAHNWECGLLRLTPGSAANHPKATVAPNQCSDPGT